MSDDTRLVEFELFMEGIRRRLETKDGSLDNSLEIIKLRIRCESIIESFIETDRQMAKDLLGRYSAVDKV